MPHFFAQLTIRELKIVGAGLDADHVEFDAGRIEAGLSFAAFFGAIGKVTPSLLTSRRACKIIHPWPRATLCRSR